MQKQNQPIKTDQEVLRKFVLDEACYFGELPTIVQVSGEFSGEYFYHQRDCFHQSMVFDRYADAQKELRKRLRFQIKDHLLSFVVIFLALFFATKNYLKTFIPFRSAFRQLERSDFKA